MRQNRRPVHELNESVKLYCPCCGKFYSSTTARARPQTTTPQLSAPYIPKGTAHYRITYTGSTKHSPQLTGYCDADWAQDEDCKRTSISGYVVASCAVANLTAALPSTGAVD